MSDEDTSIRIKTDTWKRLNDMKEPGVSFDDIINQLLEESSGNESGGQTTPMTTN